MTMKYYLFLFSILSIVYLSKAGPLRLQKRAAFYIANETACVVDNVVFSSGDPIPTDDPCEACKCRPPGFACVLKECKVKPGCRAVRHVGHCCPEYVCGCEHNGSWYSDGEKIVDERNPCYECHCLGTSIACAFADCNFRLDCVPVYVPGKCCPDYTNCSRDNPEITPVIRDNALPPANLLPELYESVLPGAFPVAEVAETTEQSQTSTSIPEPSESTDIPIVKETISDPEVEDKSPEVVDDIKEISDEKEEPKEDNVEKKDGKPQLLFNSETEIKKEDEIEATTVKEVIEDKIKVTAVKESIEDKIEVTTVKEVIEDKSTESTVSKSEVSTESVPVVREEKPIITTEIDKVVESEAEETTERHVEIEVSSTITPTTDSPIKNSAAQNSKSLKLLEDQTSEKLVEKIELIKEAVTSQNSGDETEAVTSAPTEEVPSKVETDDATVPTKLEPEVEENIAEESSNDHPSIALYSSDDKVIKKESAETVTIVVHVREKSKPPTETEKVTEAYLTSEQPEEISVKSNNIKYEISTESTKVEQATSTGKNFEVFPSSTEINYFELSTSFPKDSEEKIEARSEPDSIDLDNEEKPKTEEESDSKSNVDPPVTETALIVDEEVSEISIEAREGEIIEEIKDKEEKVDEEDPQVTEKPEEDPKVTEIPKEQKVTEKPQNELKVTEITVEQPNIALKIKITTDPEEETPKIEETEAKLDKEVTEEAKPDVEEPKPEENVESKSEEITEEAKLENAEEKVEEPKSDKLEEVKTVETIPEERSVEYEKEESKLEEVEESKLEKKVEESKPEEKVEESKPEEKLEESKPEEKVEESKPEEKVDESKPEEKVDESKPEEKVEESKPEEKVEESKPEEKIGESKSEEKVEESKPEGRIEEAKQEEKIEESKQEERIEEAKQKEKVEETNVESKNSEEKQEDQKSEEATKDQVSVKSNQPEEPKDSE